MIILQTLFFTALFLIGLLLYITTWLQNKREYQKVVKINRAVIILTVIDFGLAVLLLIIMIVSK